MKRIVLVVAAATALAGCSVLPWNQTSEDSTTITDDIGLPTASGPPENPEASPVYQQSVTWRKCGDLECASIDVPVDWSEPDGGTIALALARRPADDQGARVGSLLVNPGGPGGSGIDLVKNVEGFASTKLHGQLRHRGLRPARRGGVVAH